MTAWLPAFLSGAATSRDMKILKPTHSPRAPDVLPAVGAGPDLPLDAPPPQLRDSFAEPRAKAVARHLVALVATPRRLDRAFLAGLLIADLVFLGMFVAYAFAEHYGMRDSLFYGNVRFSFVDGGYPELYGYAKQVFIALLCLGGYSRNRQPVLLALAFLFAVVGLDDSLALHEAIGGHLATTFGVPPSRGEPAGWAMLGVLPMLAVLAGYRHSDAGSRRNAEALLLAFAVLLFFAVGIDAVHGVVSRSIGRFQTLFTVLEDGGELLSLTVICAAALAVWRDTATRRPQAGLQR